MQIVEHGGGVCVVEHTLRLMRRNSGVTRMLLLAEFFADDSQRPEWVVSSPPYQHTFAILNQALRVGQVEKAG